MLLEDGFWRVRHMVKMDAEPFKRHHKTNTIYTVSKKPILQNKTLIPSKESIITKNSAWDTFGELFNKDTIAKDFDIIKKANLNYKNYLFNMMTLKPKVKLKN
jgi:hypothetical protein